MNEWYLVSVLIAFVSGFIFGLIYALGLYKQMEADCDREWANAAECERLSRNTARCRWGPSDPSASESVKVAAP
jgi:hypothetical protein